MDFHTFMFYPKKGQNSQVRLSEHPKNNYISCREVYVLPRICLITLSINITPLPICANVRITHSRSLHIPPPQIIIFGDAQINRGDPQIDARGESRPYSHRGYHKGGKYHKTHQSGACAQEQSSWAWDLCGLEALSQPWAPYCAYDSATYQVGHHYDTVFPYQSHLDTGTCGFDSVVVGVGGEAQQLQQLGHPWLLGKIEGLETT